jgi:hypothetical protein
VLQWRCNPAATKIASLGRREPRFPALRDRAVFVGNPGDVVPDRFGAGLPAIRDWVERNYRFSGYISGFETAALLAELS